MDADAAASPGPFALLPVALLCAVLARLAADERARAAAVCRSWRAALAEPAAWTELDLTREGGLTCASLDPALILPLLCGPRLARTRLLRVLGPTSTSMPDQFLPFCASSLPGVARLVRDGQLPSLQELVFVSLVAFTRESEFGREPVDSPSVLALRELLARPSQLTVELLDVLLTDTAVQVQLLRLPGLRVQRVRWYYSAENPSATLQEALDALEQHEGLQSLAVHNLQTAAPPDLLARCVDVALARSLEELVMINLFFPPSSAMLQLARLLSECTSLRRLSLQNAWDFEAAAQFADALRANSTLQELKFVDVVLWSGLTTAGAAICAALEGHPSITSLCFLADNSMVPTDFLALDVSIAAVLGANSPALTALKLRPTPVFDGPVPPLPLICNALARNTHLRTLEFDQMFWGADFLCSVVLPAVRLNTSLRALKINDMDYLDEDAEAAALEIEQLVAARRDGSAAYAPQ